MSECASVAAESRDRWVASETVPRPYATSGQLVTCRVDELQPHPSCVRHHLAVPVSKLSALTTLGDLAFREPLVITRGRTIIDGYARRELARLRGHVTLPCLEYELTEHEALQWILRRHRRSNGLNDCCRILLALDLEPWLKDKARSNQRTGGQNKGSSNLTEANRLDVRREIACAAGVSVGNVTKVKQLLKTAHPEVLEALRAGEISIHRASLWRLEPKEKQCDLLWSHRSQQGLRKTIRSLISRHRPKVLSEAGSLLKKMSTLAPGVLSTIRVFTTEEKGIAIFISEELAQALESQEELPFNNIRLAKPTPGQEI